MFASSYCSQLLREAEVSVASPAASGVEAEARCGIVAVATSSSGRISCSQVRQHAILGCRPMAQMS